MSHHLDSWFMKEKMPLITQKSKISFLVQRAMSSEDNGFRYLHSFLLQQQGFCLAAFSYAGRGMYSISTPWRTPAR